MQSSKILLKDGQTVDLVDGRINDGDIDTWNNKLNVEITSPNGTINVQSSTDVQTNTKTFDISVNTDIVATNKDVSDLERLINNKLDSKEDVSNKIQVVHDSSTVEYPSSKAVADFVNSSVSTNTATFLGNFSLEDLGLTYPATEVQIASALNSHTWPTGYPTNNDYVYVEISNPQSSIYDKVQRYKYRGSVASWGYEYTLNNSSFTAEEMAAIDSGITSQDVTNLRVDHTTLGTHVDNTGNPHKVTKSQVGLGNVDNTSDADKPVSTAQQNALNKKLDKTGDASNTTASFTKNSGDTSSVTSGSKLSAIFTAISSFFASLKALAFKDKVSDSDINGTISNSHIASASTWNAKTAVTLNGTSASGSTASFYAPTGTGTNRRLLRSNGSGEPTWEIPAADYVFYNQTWSESGDTHTFWAFRLKGISSNAFNNILLSINTYLWNDTKSSSDLIWIGWSNNGNKGLTATAGRLRIKGNDGRATPLEYYIVKNKASTVEACTVDLYIRPASAGNGYGSFYVNVLNSGNRDLDDIIEEKGTSNVDLPEGAIKIPYSGTIGSAATAYSVDATVGNSITSTGTNGSMTILNGALSSSSGGGGSCSIDGDGISFTKGAGGSSMNSGGISTAGTGNFVGGVEAKGRPIDGSATFVTNSSLTWGGNTTHLVVNRPAASTTTIDLKNLTNGLVYWLHVPRDNIIALWNSSAISTFYCYDSAFTVNRTTDTYNIRSHIKDSSHGGFSCAIVRSNNNFYVMMDY